VDPWFENVLPGVRRRLGIQGHPCEQQPSEPEVGSALPCINAFVKDILLRCERPIYIRGCLNWSLLCSFARGVGLEIGSGTADLEVLNSEIISIFRAGRITSLGDELFSMHMDMLFLRLARRRSHAAFRTIIAHGQDTFAQEIAILLEIMRWFEAMDGATAAAHWQASLDDLHQTDACRRAKARKCKKPKAASQSTK
jgi:hypothetical protein